MSKPNVLTPYQGHEVVRTSIAIRNAGDGLSEAMDIDPIELRVGSKVFVVLECDVDDHIHKFVKAGKIKLDTMQLKQVLKAGTATIVDGALVREAIETQRDRIERARDEASGQGRLDDEALLVAHGKGEHASGLVEHCAACDKEREAVAAEAADGED